MVGTRRSPGSAAQLVPTGAAAGQVLELPLWGSVWCCPAGSHLLLQWAQRPDRSPLVSLDRVLKKGPVGAGVGGPCWVSPCRSTGATTGGAPGCPQPLSPCPHPQATPASVARLHTTGWPCPPVGLPGLAQLWHSRGHGHCPGQGPAAGRAPAQLLHTAGRALRRGGFSLPAHVVTTVTHKHKLQAFPQSCSLGAP